MGVIGILLLVAFVIVCILLICLVLLQNEEGDGFGGLLGGGSSTAFGSRSANVLTKATYVLVTLFFVVSFFLALINKSPEIKGLETTTTQQNIESSENWWATEPLDMNEVSDNTSPIQEAGENPESSISIPSNNGDYRNINNTETSFLESTTIPEENTLEKPQVIPITE